MWIFPLFLSMYYLCLFLHSWPISFMPILCFARKQILVLFFFSIGFSVLFWCWFSVFLLALNYFPTYWVGCFLLDFGVCFLRGVLKALYLSVSLQRFEGSAFVFISIVFFLTATFHYTYVYVTYTFFYSMIHLSTVFMVAFEQKFLILIESDWPVFIYSLSLLWVYKDTLIVFSKRLKLLFILHPNV